MSGSQQTQSGGGTDPFAIFGIDPSKYGAAPQAAAAPAEAAPVRNQPANKGADPFKVFGIDPSKYQVAPEQQAAAPAQSGTTLRGIGKNIAAGVTDAASSTLNVLSDPVGNLIGKPLATLGVFAHDALAPKLGYQRFDDATRNTLLGDNVPQPGTRAVDAVGSALGAPSPEDVPANSPTERLVRKGVGAGLGAAAIGPAGVLAPGLAVAGSVVGDQAAQASPDYAKPAAELLGNIGGAAAGGLAVQGLKAGGRVIGEQAGKFPTPFSVFGYGKKEDIGGVPATRSQQLAVGRQLNEALGPEGKANLNATLDAEQQAKDFEAKIADPKTPPLVRAAAQQRLDEIGSNRVEPIPGAKATTAELAQTPGAKDLDKAARVADGPAFVQRKQDVNNALVRGYQGLEPTQANPNSVGQFFAGHLAAIDHIGQQAEGAGLANVQRASGKLGGEQPTAAYGEQARNVLVDAQTPERAAASALFKKVDPDGKWAIQSAPLKGIAKQVADETSPTAQTDAQANKLLARAQALPDVIPFRTLSQLRADANDALSRLRRSGDAPVEVRRLAIFKSGIDQTIAQSIDERAAADPAFAEHVHGSVGGQADLSGRGAAEVAGSAGATANPVLDREGTGAGRPAHAGGAVEGANPGRIEPGSENPEGLTPTVGPEEANSYYEAVAAWKAQAEKFDQGGVGKVLQKDDKGFKVLEGNVPAKIFTGGPTEPAEVARFITAVGGVDKAAPIARNILANDLRTRNVTKPDGQVDAGKLRDWIRARGPTLDQIPGLRDQFETVAKAQETLNETTAAHREAIKDFNNSAAAKFIDTEPGKAIASALGGDNPTQAFTDLVQAVRGSPAATAGLKRAFVDYIDTKFKSATPSSDGLDFLKAGQFRSWVEKNKGPIRALFGGSGLNNIQAIAAVLRRQAEGATATGGSQTAPHLARGAKYNLGKVASHGGVLTALTLLGEHLGEHLGAHGAVGAGALFGLGLVGNSLKQAGIRSLSDLTREAMLHPELARTLMEKADTAQGLTIQSQQRIAQAVQAAIAADLAVHDAAKH